MIEISNIRCRGARPNDVPSIEKLIARGHSFAVPPNDLPSSAIVAELPTTTPATIGVLGFRKISTAARLMTAVYIQLLQLDCYLDDVTKGAIALRLINLVCEEVTEIGRGYVKIDVLTDDVWARDLLEGVGWTALMVSKDMPESTTYVWYVRKYCDEEETT